MSRNGKKKLIVVAYDISSNKRRNKVAKTLEKYGARVNLSVFECFLTPYKIFRLKKELQSIIKKKKDLVLFYALCKDCVNNRTEMGGVLDRATSVKVL